jgi:predicted amidohydrolase
VIRAALIQLNSGDDPAENVEQVSAYMRQAAGQGAEFILTPEVTNCVSTSRTQQNAVLTYEEGDQTLKQMRSLASELGVWVLIGSLGLKTHDSDGRFANRSFMISPDGNIAARYDKIHMFDVQVDENESFKESASYRPGGQAVVAETSFGKVGMSVCYDLRFAYLYRDLAKAGAQILTVPAAFSPVTGAAHWETLLRARAIETGCFVLAPAQTGQHPAQRGRVRKTFGNSLAVAPWGEVIAHGGVEPGITLVDIDLREVEDARNRVPSLNHDRVYLAPK